MGIYKIFYQNDPVLLSLWDLPLFGITSFICSFVYGLSPSLHYKLHESRDLVSPSFSKKVPSWCLQWFPVHNRDSVNKHAE